MLILAIPVVISFEYGKGIKLRVRYLFITFFRIPAKPKKPKKSKKAKQNAGNPPREAPAGTAPEAPAEAVKEDGKEAEKPKKAKKEKKPKDPKNPTLPEIFELVKVFVDSLGKPLKKLLKRIRICDLDLKMICGGDDAAKAALKFGAMNLVVSNAMGYLDVFFTLRNPRVDINVDFQSEETITECSCKVRMSAMIFLMFAFTFLGRFLMRALKSEKITGWLARRKGSKNKKAKKQVESGQD